MLLRTLLLLMAIRFPPTGEVKHFPGTNGPVLLIAPDRSRVPVYGQGRPIVAFFPPAGYYAPPPRGAPGPLPPPGPGPGPAPGPGPGPTPTPGEESVVMESVVSELRNCELCGFDAFANPATPPEKYRRQEIAGTLDVTEYYDTSTCVEEALKGETHIDYTGFITDSPLLWWIEGIVTIISFNDDLTITYSVSGIVGRYWDGAMWVAVPSRGFVSGIGIVINGSTFNGSGMLMGTIFSFDCQVNYLYWHGASEFLIAGKYPGFIDTWEIIRQYDPLTCIRADSGSGVMRSIFGQAAYPVVADNPAVLYYPRFTQSSVYQIQPVYISTTPGDLVIQTAGLGCVVGSIFGGPASMKALGAIDNQLSDPDTEPDAIIRATPIPGTDLVAFYEPRTVFTFEHQTVAFDLSCADLTPGQAYEVTVPITTEDYGGGSPVVGSLTYNFTASGPTELISDVVIPARGTQVTIGSPPVIAPV